MRLPIMEEVNITMPYDNVEMYATQLEDGSNFAIGDIYNLSPSNVTTSFKP